MAKAKPVILDSWAIMAYLSGERSASRVGEIIADAAESRLPLLMSTINAGEIWYIIARCAGEEEADRTIADLLSFGVRFIDPDREMTNAAARFKVNRKISFADCFAAALTQQSSGRLVTGDTEFEQLAETIEIDWLK